MKDQLPIGHRLALVHAYIVGLSGIAIEPRANFVAQSLSRLQGGGCVLLGPQRLRLEICASSGGIYAEVNYGAQDPQSVRIATALNHYLQAKDHGYSLELWFLLAYCQGLSHASKRDPDYDHEIAPIKRFDAVIGTQGTWEVTIRVGMVTWWTIRITKEEGKYTVTSRNRAKPELEVLLNHN